MYRTLATILWSFMAVFSNSLLNYIQTVSVKLNLKLIMYTSHLYHSPLKNFQWVYSEIMLCIYHTPVHLKEKVHVAFFLTCSVTVSVFIR